MKNEPKAKNDRHSPVVYVTWAGMDDGRYRDCTDDPAKVDVNAGDTVVAAKYELVGYVRISNKITVES